MDAWAHVQYQINFKRFASPASALLHTYVPNWLEVLSKVSIRSLHRYPVKSCLAEEILQAPKSSSQSVQGLAFVQVLCIEARHFVTFSIFGFGLEPGVDRNLQRRGGGGGLGGKFVGSHRVRAGGPFSGGHWGGDEEVGNRGNPYRNL